MPAYLLMRSTAAAYVYLGTRLLYASVLLITLPAAQVWIILHCINSYLQSH